MVEALVGLFPSAIIDRRANPSHGYRAIHAIAQAEGKLVEIQVRTALQHLWAEYSEKLSDVINPAIKYGGGEAGTQASLLSLSDTVARLEVLEDRLAETHLKVSHFRPIPGDLAARIKENEEDIGIVKADLFAAFQRLINELPRERKQSHDFSD